MHSCCSFPEDPEGVASDPLLLTAVPKICHGCDKGEVLKEVKSVLRRHKYGHYLPTLPRGV